MTILQHSNPPTTTRWCFVCEKQRTFMYSKHIMHSKCVECGSRFGDKNIKKSKSNEAIILKIEKHMKEKEQQILNLKSSIASMKGQIKKLQEEIVRGFE
jgi:C4-type Zn-finger protein